MLEFLVDNIFVVFAEKVFQQLIGIPLSKNCAHLLADIFLYSNETEFVQCFLVRNVKKQLASQFNLNNITPRKDQLDLFRIISVSFVLH